jgi:hypothetical protein
VLLVVGVLVVVGGATGAVGAVVVVGTVVDVDDNVIEELATETGVTTSGVGCGGSGGVAGGCSTCCNDGGGRMACRV